MANSRPIISKGLQNSDCVQQVVLGSIDSPWVTRNLNEACTLIKEVRDVPQYTNADIDHLHHSVCVFLYFWY